MIPSCFFLSCLSPNEMQISIAVGNYAALFGAAVLVMMIVASHRRRQAGLLPLAIALFLVHPSWTIPATGGDCGDAKRFLSLVVSFLMTALLLCHTFSPQTLRRTMIMWISIACWIVYAPLFLFRVAVIQFAPEDTVIGRIIQSYVMSAGHLAIMAVTFTVAVVVSWSISLLKRQSYSRKQEQGRR